jgi:EmrB/QacA subfamily drug resistance transporter
MEPIFCRRFALQGPCFNDAQAFIISSMPRDRIVPLIIAVALFMENMDSTVIATSLPAIAADIGTNPLALKLAVTSYLLSLAIFIPASGWTADRFGARTVFRAAIGVFVLGSIGCALSSSLTDFVVARIVQGMGGAMMTPVGRMVLVRTISKRELVAAMAWVTTPALIGPVLGPPVGGLITTYATWHWIFIINVPIGLLGIALATRFIPDVRSEEQVRFDIVGMVLAGLGIGGMAFGLSVLGLNFLPWFVVAGLIFGGACFFAAYLVHARHTENPALDLSLFRLPTFFVAVCGGFIFRLGLGALPFLLPLMLQIGFGMTPFQSGMITFATAFGAMGMKWATAFILRRFGFRKILVVNSIISSAFLAVCAGFTATTPVAMMMFLLLVGGFFRSLQFTSINTIAYADVEPNRVSRATALVSVAQQLAVSSGVALGAMSVELTVYLRGGGPLQAADFPPAFLVVSAISALSVLIFLSLQNEAGAEMADRLPTPTETSDQRVG